MYHWCMFSKPQLKEDVNRSTNSWYVFLFMFYRFWINHFLKLQAVKDYKKNMFRLFLMMNFSIHIISTVDWIFELEFFGNCNALASFDVEDVNGSHHIASWNKLFLMAFLQIFIQLNQTVLQNKENAKQTPNNLGLCI